MANTKFKKNKNKTTHIILKATALKAVKKSQIMLREKKYALLLMNQQINLGKPVYPFDSNQIKSKVLFTFWKLYPALA